MRLKKMTVILVFGIIIGIAVPSAVSYATNIAAENISEKSLSDIMDMDGTIDEKIFVKNQRLYQNDIFEDVNLPDAKDNVYYSGENATSDGASGHNTADTALYVDSSYFGNVLADLATDSENWYYFYLDDKSKISVVLEQPTSGGDYDIYLYKYSDDGTLTLCSYSICDGSTMENLSAVGESGYYFLRVVPETATTETDAVYFFMITPITEYDACEPDDMPEFATEYTDVLNVNNSIDNLYDQDWFQLTISSGGNYIVSLSNIPDESTYNVYIYDASYDFVAGMSCSENKVGTINMSSGIYYIQVFSESGYSTTQSYNLKVIKRKDTSSKMIYTKTGQIVELTASVLYINGSPVDMNWSYNFSGSSYNRRQQIKTKDSTTFDVSVLKNGTYSGPQSVSSEDCIAVQMNNFNYIYFYRADGAGANYDYINEPIEYYSWFYVDAVTGKVIDTEWNYYYWSLNMPQTFKED